MSTVILKSNIRRNGHYPQIDLPSTRWQTQTVKAFLSMVGDSDKGTSGLAR
jgi:hypothetical protein